MKLVVDTNVILAALIKNSVTRSILLNPNHNFYLPEFALDEAKKYSKIIMSKSGFGEKEFKLLIDRVLSNMEVVPVKRIIPGFKKAEMAMRNIDEKDVPFLALSLSIDCDGIWSNDEDFKRQKLAKIFSTEELLKAIH